MGLGVGRYTGQNLDATSPLRRDTILVPAFSWVVLRFITDNREHPFIALRLLGIT
jgi:Multicopper oxidase